MNGFDLVILGVLAVFGVIGAWRGFVREIIGFLSWVVACAVAWWYAAPVAALFSSLSGEPELREVLAFVSIFLVVFAVGLVAAWWLNRRLPAAGALRVSNTLLGAATGLARGVVIVMIAFMLGGLTSYPERPWWHDSTLSPYFDRLATLAAGYIPRDVARHIRYS